MKLLCLTMFAGAIWAAGAQAAVLYDQTSPAENGAGILSTQFDTDPAYDVLIKDDFVVPAGESWRIDGVDVHGYFYGEPPPTVNIFIYADAAGIPGAQRFAQIDAAATGGPDYAVPVAGAPELAAGTYWVGVQQSHGYVGDGVDAWYWGIRSTRTGSALDISYADPVRESPPGSPRRCRSSYCDLELDTVFKLSGTRTLTPKAKKAACTPSVSSAAYNFRPRKGRPPSVLGVRAQLNVGEPSHLDVDATLAYRSNGKTVTTALARKALDNQGVAKVRFVLPDSVKGELSRGDRVKLQLAVTATPLSSVGCTTAESKTSMLATKVVNVRAAAAD
jgi:hypothetical protein